MKKCLFLFLLCTTGFVQAQYFHKTFYYGGGSPLNTSFGAGHNAYNGGNTGHFICGELNAEAIAGARLDITGTGGPSSPYHYKSYQVFNASSEDLVVDPDVRSLEFANGDGFALVGSYEDENENPSIHGIYFLLVTPTGTITSVDGYLPGFAAPYALPSDVTVTAITESLQDDEEFYVTGYIHVGYPSANSTRVFVLKLNHSGTITWSYIYDLNTELNDNDDKAYGIVESAYMNGNTYEVLVVGQSISDLAFILRLDYSTGLVTDTKMYGNDVVFTAIKNSDNTAVDANGKGYVLAGSYNNSNSDFWFVAIDQSGSVAWSHRFNYESSSNDYCFDVIERLNTSDEYEYYLAGYTDDGYFGGNDMLVIKTDANGDGVTNGQFTYGTSETDEFCYRIDQFNGTSADGISMYGTRKIGSNPTYFWLMKAYFNGVTYCDYYLEDPEQSGGPEGFFDVDGEDVFEFEPEDLLADDYITGNKNTHCYDSDVDGGNNDRQGYIGTKPSQNNNIASIVPNPVNTNSGEVTITLAEANDAPARIMVADMLGRVYYNEVVVPNGVNYKVNIQNQLRPGTYVVNIITAGRSIKQIVLVK